MRALIVDDEAPARAKLRRLLADDADIEVIGEAHNGREALAAIKQSVPDIVFLDIQMPGLDGFDVAAAIERDGGPYIVFVTANDQHALQAFEVGAVDYLLKPFTPERFARVLERAKERLSTPLVVAAPTTAFLRRILVIDDGRATFVPVEAIDRVEAERNYVMLHVGRDVHRLRATLGTLEHRLDPAQFLRINRSTLVRFDAVREMHEWSHGDFRVVMSDGTELIWSRRFRAAAAGRFGL
jgi:two-component system LytT family response regulator